MLSKELQAFIEQQSAHLQKLHTDLSDTERLAYARTVKLTEEVGELSEAVLDRFSRQRKSKAGKVISFEKEAADVIISTLLLAELLGIRMDTALRARIEDLIGRRKSD